MLRRMRKIINLILLIFIMLIDAMEKGSRIPGGSLRGALPLKSKLIIMKTMKISLTIVVIGIFLLSTECKSVPKEKTEKPLTINEIVRNSTEEYLKDKLNDPDSYEFVKLVLLDSVLYKDNITYRKDMFINHLDTYQNDLESQLSWKKLVPSMYDEQNILEIKANIEETIKILSAIDSLESVMGDMVNDVASYTFIFSFRATNAMSAKVLEKYYLQTSESPNYEVLNLAEDMDQLYLNPGDFPGYIDMVKKYKGY